MATCFGIVCLALAGFAAFLLPPAGAAVITDRIPLFTFNPGGGTFETNKHVRDLAVDPSTGSVYVLNTNESVVAKFNANGEAANFSALGDPALPVPLGDGSKIAVDGSSANPGRIYVVDQGSRIRAFSPAGEPLWVLTGVAPCGIAVDTEGHVWIAERNAKKVREFASSGSPPAEVGSFSTTLNACWPDVDTDGDVYVGQESGGGQFRADKYVGGAFDSTLDAAFIQDLNVDQSGPTGHVFTTHYENFNEYSAGGALLGTFGANTTLVGVQGVDYNATLDRVYVANFSGLVTAFGPAITGTVPDPTIEPTTAIGVFKATFHGKVNPQGVPNNYFFQWKAGIGPWGESKVATSPPQSLPEDSSDHVVEFANESLRGDTTYQVRLVVENTANELRTVTSVDTFSTAKASAAPSVTIDPPSSVGTTTASIAGTIDPEGDTADWLVQTSTDPTCAGGFTDEATQSLAQGGDAPVGISYDLTDLLPNQHYCVRIRATNSFGTTVSVTKELTTEPVIPSRVSTAFASPRLDASARLNGYVNPEGADASNPLIYRFEFSEDGTTWTSLPAQQYTEAAREQIVLGQELAGLTPSTTYSFRFSAESSAGAASSQGDVETFTTRSSTEVEAPNRGMELVNQPDKGNQNIFAEIETAAAPPMTADGNRVIWWGYSGIPGGTASSQGAFLSERTAGGWTSRNLIPPVARQIGDGNLTYFDDKATPDFDQFLFGVGEGEGAKKTVVRLDRSQNQEVLAQYGIGAQPNQAEISTDGSHVLIVNPDTQQLEDIGGATPETISVMPDGTPSECGLEVDGSSFVGMNGPRNDASHNWNVGYRRMEIDGASRAYFQVKPNGSCGSSSNRALYQRNRESNETTLIDSASEGEVNLIRATPDGRHAFFTTPSTLDSADTNGGRDVYRWDESTGESVCLTCVVSNAKVSDSVLVSDDFSHVYFKSKEQLIPNMGEVGQEKTYALSGGELRFVASRAVGVLGTILGEGEALLSSDGNVLVFRSAGGLDPRALTADHQADECFTYVEFTPCQQLYRYDDRDGSLECVSCRHDGETTLSLARTGFGSDFRMSRDGSTIAFATDEALIREDVNQDTDVYEWRNGAVHLVTDGLRTFQKSFAAPQMRAVSDDGGAILFTAVAPGLTGFEHDGLVNIYEARLGGGFDPPAPRPRCEGDACQGALQAPPALRPPSSASFQGRGNLESTPARCGARKVRRNGRCAPRRQTCRKRRGKAKRRCQRTFNRLQEVHLHLGGADGNLGRVK
jgi:hypothetical protein